MASGLRGSRAYRLIAKLAYAEKWLVLGLIVGVVSGLFVLGFFVMLKYVVMYAAHFVGSTTPPIGRAEVDLSAAVAVGGFDRLRLYIVLLLGAAASSVIVYSLAPEAEGHGTDAAVAAFHRRAAIIPFKVPIVKLVASALAVGTGSSGGVEGPSVQMGAGTGSTLARLLHLPLKERRIMLVAGIAGALSAMFRAPIGSAFFAVEVLYKRDLEVDAFMPSIVSSIASYSITASYFEYRPLLPRIPVSNEILYSPETLLLLLGLGVFVAPFSWLYVKAFRNAKDFFDRLVERTGISVYLKPILGALAAGVIIVSIPVVAGSGRGVLAMAIEGSIVDYIPHPGGVPLWVILVGVAIAKIIATSLSIGSGASGGVYAPGLLTGALLGLAFYQLVHPSGLSPHLFSYVGMAAFFGAAAKVPLATSVMVGEMGGNYLLIAPTLISSYIAREIAGAESIYESQIPRRLHREAVTAEGLLVLLRSSGVRLDLRAIDVIDVTYKPLPAEAKLRDALRLMVEERGKVIPVVDSEGRILGVLDPEDLESIIEELGGDLDVPVGSLRLKIPPIIDRETDLERALEAMVEHATDYAVVVSPDGRYIGVITVDDVSAAIAYLIAEKCPRRRRLKGCAREG
ncbi:MAG: chloride channel protein [Desulfurococcales archaeon]|nr:chloride channel protein [Desulfurococcales archaeon]